MVTMIRNLCKSHRILIIGSAGSGKSTFSEKLGELLSLPVIHLDQYFWKPHWQKTSDSEWEAVLEKLLQQEKWILEGQFAFLERRMQAADTVIFLKLPLWLCLWRILKRRILYHNKVRPDRPAGCSEKISGVLILGLLKARLKYYPQVATLFKTYGCSKTCLVLSSRKEVELLLTEYKPRGIMT